MTPERWQQVSGIYKAALDHAPASRDAFLAEICAGDDGLRQEVESLLAQDDASALLDKPAWTTDNLAVPAASLTIGSSIGPYRIEGILGAGGMGQVYRASDSRLKRQVALKILPPLFSHDADRLARFQREAQLLASLNHPHIAAVFGLEEGDGVKALVMELVEGEDLAARIAKGALPLDEAIALARQIAEAMAAAHQQGVIHRDLKPANIRVRPDGTVKVLDFGLAKLAEAQGSGPGTQGQELTHSPTITTPAMTHAGMILGTAAYMSPEQAKGLPADKRSDVFAFGCVLYEMLTAKRAFEGEDVADTLASILKSQPDWRALPSHTPKSIVTLLRGCLQKDRKARIGDISTALFVFANLDESSDQDALPKTPRRLAWARAAGLVAAGLAIGALLVAAAAWRVEPPPPGQVTRFSFRLPEGQLLTANRKAVAISPDGTRIAYAADGRLFLRHLAAFESSAISGAEPGLTPAFSPDGRNVVFWADALLKRVAVEGGAATTICPLVGAPGSLAWVSDDRILYVDAGGLAIREVSARGGEPRLLVDMKTSESDELADGPQLLPDGDTLLFTIVKRTDLQASRWNTSSVVRQSLETGARTVVFDGGNNAQYVESGHIVYMSEGTLFAVPFSADRLAVTGPAVPVVEGLSRANSAASPGGRTGHFAISKSGTLVYVRGSLSPGQNEDLVLFGDREVKALGLRRGYYEFPRVSPDDSQVAYGHSDGKEAAVWVYDLSGASAARRLTFGSNNRFPAWSHDGGHVAFQSDREGDRGIFWQRSDGGAVERLTTAEPGTAHVPDSFSPDGKALLFSATKSFVSSLWVLSLPERTVAPFSQVRNSAIPPDAVFSPNGRWVVYQTGASDDVEGTTYVEPFPPTGTKSEVTRGGRPVWSRDGQRLFIIPAPGRLLTVPVLTETPLTFGSAVSAPRRFGVATPAQPRTFDILKDGRFLAVGTVSQGQGLPELSEIRVVVNWFEELNAKAPKP